MHITAVNHNKKEKHSMARKQIVKPDADPESFTPSIKEGVERMWKKNGAAAIVFAEESNKKKVSVSFNVDIDLSKSDPVAEVGIRFSQSVTDSVKFTIDNPNQGTFTELIESKPEGKGPNRGESDETRGDKEPKEPKKRGKNNPQNN